MLNASGWFSTWPINFSDVIPRFQRRRRRRISVGGGGGGGGRQEEEEEEGMIK